VEDDLIPHNPAAHYGIPSTSREITVWTPAQVEIAQRHANSRFFDFFEAVLATGARPGEIAKFTPTQHYQELNGQPFAVLSTKEWKNGRKTGQRRYIPLPDWLAAKAKHHRTKGDVGPLFLSQKQKPWMKDSWAAAIKRMRERAERAGEPLPHVRFYDLRSTFITNALLDGFPIEWVAKAVGSSARVIEKHYWAYVEEGVKRMGDIVRRQDEKRNRPRIAKAVG
jgi:integrase